MHAPVTAETFWAYLWAQLEQADRINESRLNAWRMYHEGLRELENAGKISLPFVPDGCEHNAHMFYIKLRDLEERTAFISHMKERGVGCVFHYVPLHSAPAGMKFGRFSGEDEYTTKESDRLVRLPMYFGMDEKTVCEVIHFIREIYI